MALNVTEHTKQTKKATKIIPFNLLERLFNMKQAISAAFIKTKTAPVIET